MAPQEVTHKEQLFKFGIGHTRGVKIEVLMSTAGQHIETDWVSAPRQIRGQDQLGCQAPCELTYSQLLPGITNVTDRARYFSFYPWVTWSLDKLFSAVTEDRYVELYRRADCLYTLIAAQESKTSGNVRQAEAMIGRLRLLPALDRLTSGTPLRLSDYATQEESDERYFKNRMGGLGQYYVGSLAELGVCAKAPSGPWIKYTEEFGKVLATSFDATLPSNDFWAAVESDVITIKDLVALKAFSPHLLIDGSEEQNLLLDMFFVRNRYSESVGSLKGLQRRHTLALILHLADSLSASDEIWLSEWTFRPIVYSGAISSSAAWELPSSLLETRKLWSIYERNDLLSSACLIVFAASLRQLRREASDDFTHYESVEGFSEHYAANPDFMAALETLSANTFGALVENVTKEGPLLAHWKDPMHEFSLEDQLVADWYAQKKSSHDLIANAILLLASLAARQTDFPTAYGNLLIQADELETYPINLVSFHKRAAGWASTPLDLVAKDLIAWCLNTHLTVALRKLWQTRTSSFHIRPAENGLQVIGDIPPPTRTLPRIRQSLRILEDLGALEEHATDRGRLLLTPLGQALLEEALV